MIKNRGALMLFLLPGLLGLTLFFAVPFCWGIYYSLTDGSMKNTFVGFSNYLKVWENQMFRMGLKNTLQLSLLCTPLVFTFSFVVSVMLRALGTRKSAAFYRNALLVPYLMPSAAILLIWLLLFDYGGAMNRMVAYFGYERVLWKEGAALRVPIILLYVWKNLGFSVVIFTAALQAVPEAYYEYARLEGARAIQMELHITLPLIASTAFLVLVLAWINAFKIFKEVYFIGGSYPDPSVYTLQHFMNNHFTNINYQYVTTAAYSFAVIVIALFALLYAVEIRMRRSLT